MANLEKAVNRKVPESRSKVKRKHLDLIKLVGSFGRPWGNWRSPALSIVLGDESTRRPAIARSLGYAVSLPLKLVLGQNASPPFEINRRSVVAISFSFIRLHSARYLR